MIAFVTASDTAVFISAISSKVGSNFAAKDAAITLANFHFQIWQKTLLP